MIFQLTCCDIVPLRISGLASYFAEHYVLSWWASSDAMVVATLQSVCLSFFQGSISAALLLQLT